MYYSLKMQKVSQKVPVVDADGNASNSDPKESITWQPYQELLKAKTETTDAVYGPYQWRFGPKLIGASFARIDSLLR